MNSPPSFLWKLPQYARRHSDNYSLTPFHHAQLHGGAATNFLLFCEMMIVSYSFLNNTQPVFAQTRNSGVHSDHWLKERHHPRLIAWRYRYSSDRHTPVCPYDRESFLLINKALAEHQEQRAHYPSFPPQAQCKVWLYNSPYNPISALYRGWVLTLYKLGE